jgi:hypothetical protein
MILVFVEDTLHHVSLVHRYYRRHRFSLRWSRRSWRHGRGHGRLNNGTTSPPKRRPKGNTVASLAK